MAGDDAGYHRSNRRVISRDPYWEDVLTDVRAGYVRLDRTPGEYGAWIVVVSPSVEIGHG